ncbi:MAG: isopenicillin N synthase family oxygenase [Okeania sp. SIO3B5]|uniref:isopenicillin N synthase family dioxygenase n=1 Tax=Okeania sp. SIO3B5 TaxID=2607811 RepID=UPI0014018646|nr:2-oxoglutarate and iron-dependent oxygenase domain-containing protein [Okeania sp. SIO3B5]NEO52872.1 isopenicillin N synthase family oxygenase [Okeania sp. SIO3B5]
MENLPIISLKKLAQEDAQEIERLYLACDDSGFFYLNDYGIAKEVIEETIAASRQFFKLPEAIKKEYRQDIQTVSPKTSRGYIPLYGEAVNGTAGFDPKESFNFGLERPHSEKPFTGKTIFPDDTVAPGFASCNYRLQNEIMTKVVPPLLKGIALALGLEARWFDRFFTDPILIHRAAYYPPETGKAGKHTDSGMFTILIQENLPGESLRVKTDSRWISVPCLEDAFVINLGDILQMWTKGKFVSTPHEVVHNLPVSRISIPLFLYPNIDSIIEPFGTDEKISTMDVMLTDYRSIWETHEGAGRAKELT